MGFWVLGLGFWVLFGFMVFGHLGFIERKEGGQAFRFQGLVCYTCFGHLGCSAMRGQEGGGGGEEGEGLRVFGWGEL